MEKENHGVNHKANESIKGIKPIKRFSSTRNTKKTTITVAKKNTKCM